MKARGQTTFFLALLLAAAPVLAFDVAGVPLGGSEADVLRAFPSAHCKPLEWKSDAADRRCDDARGTLAGVAARVTFYLRGGSIRAFDVRFDMAQLDRVKAHLQQRWGKPLAEGTETVARAEQPDRKVFKMRWEKGGESALLVAQLERKRAALEAARGNFFDEIYRVK
jgi:hypothetical protein